MAEDYSDLDPNKVVLSFRGRGDGTEVNIIDKCLEEILLQRRKEAVERGHGVNIEEAAGRLCGSSRGKRAAWR